MNAIDFFDRGASRYSDRPFLVFGDRVTTYSEAYIRSCRIANALRAEGLDIGDKVAILSPNHDWAFECLLGLFRAGCVWVTLNARNAAQQNSAIITQTDTRALFYHSVCEEEVRRFHNDCPDLRIFVCIDQPRADERFLLDWIRDRASEPAEAVVSCEDLYAIYATGGTTGGPKLVAQTNLVMETKVASFLIHAPPQKPPVYLLVAPWSHAGGSIAQMLMSHGATIHIMSKFEPCAVLESIERDRVTHVFLPPTAVYMLLAHPNVRNFDYSTLEYFFYGAAPISLAKLKEAISVFGPVMAQCYGQVEAPSMCTFLSREDHVEALRDERLWRRLSSCGRATALMRVEIINEAGAILPPETAGEIVVRGNLVMRGYYKNDVATSGTRTPGGWHRTGDIGLKDTDGFVYIVDRKHDLIISGGFNLYPSEIEQLLWTHPSVQDCAVIGIPDEKWGEAVHAVIELKPGANASSDEIIKLCRDQLGALKAPKSVEFWPQLPRSPVGKVLKRTIRAAYWEGRDRNI